MLSLRGAFAVAPSGGASTRPAVLLPLICGILWLGPTPATATSSSSSPTSDSSSGCPTAVVGLNADARSGDTLDRIARLVADAGCEPVRADQLRDTLDDLRARDVADETSEAFTGLPSDIGAGLEHFFYESADGALEKLAPKFELGRQHPRVLGGRPDYADQIWQAGVVIVRIHLQNERPERARTVARQLAELLPPREVDPKNVPPKARKLIERQRDALADSNTRLAVSPARLDGCKAYINGVQAPDGPIPVDASRPYFVLTDCGTSSRRVWRLPVDEGATRSYVLPGSDPTRLSADPRDETSRSETARRVATLASLTAVDHVVGVAATDADRKPTLLHVDGEGDAKWAGIDQPRPLRGALRTAWPGRAEHAGDAWRQPDPESAPDTSNGGIDVAGLALTAGGGTVALGGVGYYLFGVRPLARLLDCSPNTATLQPDAPACSGVEIRQLSRDEVDRTERLVSTARTASFVATGVGTAAAGYGVYRLLTHPETSDEPTALRLTVDPFLRRTTLKVRFK